MAPSQELQALFTMLNAREDRFDYAQYIIDAQAHPELAIRGKNGGDDYFEVDVSTGRIKGLPVG